MTFEPCLDSISSRLTTARDARQAATGRVHDFPSRCPSRLSQCWRYVLQRTSTKARPRGESRDRGRAGRTCERGPCMATPAMQARQATDRPTDGQLSRGNAAHAAICGRVKLSRCSLPPSLRPAREVAATPPARDKREKNQTVFFSTHPGWKAKPGTSEQGTSRTPTGSESRSSGGGPGEDLYIPYISYIRYRLCSIASLYAPQNRSFCML